MKRIWISALSIVTVMCVAAQGWCEKPTIGVVLPLTGKAAAAGEAVRNSIMMANDDLGSPFQLIFEDNSLAMLCRHGLVRSWMGRYVSVLVDEPDLLYLLGSKFSLESLRKGPPGYTLGG